MPVNYQIIISKTISFFSIFPNFFHKIFVHDEQDFQT